MLERIAENWSEETIDQFFNKSILLVASYIVFGICFYLALKLITNYMSIDQRLIETDKSSVVETNVDTTSAQRTA